LEGETYFANATELSIPAALADLVDGFDGLNNFPLRSMMATKGLASNPDVNAGGQHYLAPDDLAMIYNINPLYNGGVNGSGQKIAIVGQGNINVADIQAFRTRFHLPPSDLQTVLVGPDPGNGGIEPYLDIEWAGAVAPNASIIYVYSRDANTAAQFVVDHNLAPVISESYGACEPEYTPSLRSIAQQANAQGITWLAASGDSGAAGCELQGIHPQATRGMAVLFPASLPEVTAVGGSQFDEGSGNYWATTNGTNSGSALSYIPETAWNENDNSGLYSSGGGASIFFSQTLLADRPGRAQRQRARCARCFSVVCWSRWLLGRCRRRELHRLRNLRRDAILRGDRCAAQPVRSVQWISGPARSGQYKPLALSSGSERQ
jgi:subtilase family serine protease